MDRPINSFLLFSVKKMFVWKRELKIGSSGANDQLTFSFQTNLLVTASLSLSLNANNSPSGLAFKRERKVDAVINQEIPGVFISLFNNESMVLKDRS